MNRFSLILCLMMSALFSMKAEEKDFMYGGETKQIRMSIVKDGKVDWTYCNQEWQGEISDAILLADGNILMAHKFGIAEINKQKQTLWHYNAPEGTEIHTLQPIGNNHVVFVQNGNPAKVRIMKIPECQIVHEFEIPVSSSVQGQFRNARLSSRGTLLVCHMSAGYVAEYSVQGRELCRWPVPGVWSVSEVGKEHLLVVDNRGMVKEMTRDGKTVKEHPELNLTNAQKTVEVDANQAVNRNRLFFGDYNGRWPKLFCQPNQPLGVGKGVHPGRVAWVHNSGVATWDGTTGLWMEDRWNNQDKADRMVTEAIKSLAGEKDPQKAWKALFTNFNQTHNRGKKGYRKGESIVVKLNMNNALTHHDTIELNSSPFITLALVRSMVKEAKVREQDIIICEPSRAITDSIYNKVHREFPKVRFIDNIGGDGREKCEYYPEQIKYSVDNGKMARGLAKCVVEADYLINSALLKTHSGPGVTLTGKNWYGATDINLLWRQNAHNNVSQDKRHGKPAFKTFVDWISHPNMGGKCLLFLIDGTYGSRDVNGKPFPKWQKAPYNGEWACSLILSQDPLAGDAVAMDMLINEWPEFGSMNYCDEYLLEAATIPNTNSGTVYMQNGKPLTEPLGLFEHCNKEGKYTKLDLQYIDIE